ncbi:glycosyltransferase family 4 protein [uncultured Pontibacter sp.]|uniref:glycosyltransferase family 4 protein n=1 Tax=uncultured Pontibacter sp. TaxID=453356 RepID=UPI0026206CF6|nr:glycosyltransferase family 4 protein [uncultured Pontibacter sp.]
MKYKFLFLYTELADYFLACVHALVLEHQAEVHIVRWPVNKEAPFQFKIPEGVTIYNKEQFNRQELVELAQGLNPDLVFCSGWLDKDYLAVARAFRKEIPVLLGLDNHWYGTPKQYAGRLLAPFTLKRIFTHAFVAGAPQAVYARKLSFAPGVILQGYYSANVPVFYQQYQQHVHFKAATFPKRFIYVGRYVPQKGLDTLWEAFTALQAEQPNEWELWCLGTGPLEQEATVHAKIKHFGFVQPDELKRFIGETGVFILPSLFEPWGVVVHEFAAAGFPLICSDKVGAATAFLEDSMNGYTFKAGEVSSLKRALIKIMRQSDTELLDMGRRSAALALQNTPSIWAQKLMKLVK